MRRLTRRSLLRSAAPAFGAALLAHHASALVHAAAPLGKSLIGSSQGGWPLDMYHLGRGRTRVLLLGGQHGWPEANTVELVLELLRYFAETPGALPARVGLDAILVGNPDGFHEGSRQYLSGVDPNRNWGGSDWQPDAFDSNGAYRLGLGGEGPFSEQETYDLASWIVWNRPALVVNYHSAGGFLSAFGGQADDLVGAYALASAYPRTGLDLAANPFGYTVTGSLDDWLPEVGLAGLLVELTDSADAELDRNIEGLYAVLLQLAGG